MAKAKKTKDTNIKVVIGPQEYKSIYDLYAYFGKCPFKVHMNLGPGESYELEVTGVTLDKHGQPELFDTDLEVELPTGGKTKFQITGAYLGRPVFTIGAPPSQVERELDLARRLVDELNDVISGTAGLFEQYGHLIRLRPNALGLPADTDLSGLQFEIDDQSKLFRTKGLTGFALGPTQSFVNGQPVGTLILVWALEELIKNNKTSAKSETLSLSATRTGIEVGDGRTSLSWKEAEDILQAARETIPSKKPTVVAIAPQTGDSSVVKEGQVGEIR